MKLLDMDTDRFDIVMNTRGDLLPRSTKSTMTMGESATVSSERKRDNDNAALKKSSTTIIIVSGYFPKKKSE